LNRDLATEAKIDPTTLHRMEKSGDETARGHARNVERVIQALRQNGVEISEDGSIRRVGKPHKRL